MQNIENPGPPAYVGLIPAAGVGSRLPDRRAAKEMLPVGPSGKPVVCRLIQHMQAAGVDDITVVLRPQKQDLTEYLGNEKWQHLNFRLAFTAGTAGVPQTIALGLRELEGRGLEDRNVVFGFPDILFKPGDVLPKMMAALDASTADVVLGLFPAGNPSKSDMVAKDKDDNVIDIEIKPRSTMLNLTWSLAVWRPTFTRYLTTLLRNESSRVAASADNPADQQLGQVFKLALADGLTISASIFHDGVSLDIGTPDDLALAQAWHD